jgi:hypothetical protein
LPESALYNPVHSSDNASQALDYLEALDDPGVESRVRQRAQRLLEAWGFPYPVIRLLPGEVGRARVAVVQHPIHGPSVCKVFRPGAARFLERELRARKDLGDLPEVPTLLESGPSWLLSPLYGDDRSHVRRRLPGSGGAQLVPGASRALARFAVTLHERGLFLLDLSTDDLLCDPTTGLKVLDFELLQEYAEPVVDPVRSYSFRGLPDGVQGYDEPVPDDRAGPPGRAGAPTGPRATFHPAVTGSSVPALLRPDRFLDRPRRSLVQMAWYLLLASRSRFAAVRHDVVSSRWGRDVAGVARLVRRVVRCR